jgi:hypothetical protein
MYATLVQAGIFIKKDVTVWNEAYRKILEGINTKDWKEAGQLRVRHDFNLTGPAR